MGFIVEGDRVTIYQDAITCQKREGRAMVIKVLKKEDNGLVECLVRFVDETEEFIRLVNLSNK